MAERIKALVEPVLLVWARKTASISFEDAAKAIGVTPERLDAWEEGREAPTINQLRKLAAKYKRPLSVFFLPEPPKDFQPLRDFRRLPDTPPGVYSAKLTFEIRAAYERRLVALDLTEGLGEEPATLGVTALIDENPEDVAVRLRGRLSVTIEQQSQWGEPEKAFKAWREVIEAVGVLVFVLSGAHHQVSLDEMRGFSVADQPLPIIVVNGKDRTNARIFTLLHELAHVVIGQSAIENEIEPGDAIPPADRATEAFCNRVAAAVLMPQDDLLAETIVRAKQKGREPWNDAEIAALARRYAVSREALLLRLVQLNRVDRAFFEAKRQEYLEHYRMIAEAEKDAETGFAPYQYQVLSYLGRTFSRMVLQSYYARQITLSTVSGYLGLQAKFVPTIERIAFAQTG